MDTFFKLIDNGDIPSTPHHYWGWAALPPVLHAGLTLPVLAPLIYTELTHVFAALAFIIATVIWFFFFLRGPAFFYKAGFLAAVRPGAPESSVRPDPFYVLMAIGMLCVSFGFPFFVDTSAYISLETFCALELFIFTYAAFLYVNAYAFGKIKGYETLQLFSNLYQVGESEISNIKAVHA